MILQFIRAFIFIVIICGLASSQDSFQIRMMNGHATVKKNGKINYIEVGWQTTLEKGFSYYVLQRSLPDSARSRDTSSWQDIVRIDTINTTDTMKTYIYSDYPPLAASYGYRVKILFKDSSRAYFEFASVPAWALTSAGTWTNQEIPLEYGCIRNYPNPFNPTTTIILNLPAAESGSLDIVDLLGRKIESLTEGSLHSGIHRYQWDASNYPSGIYYCILRTNTKTICAKLVLQK